MPGGGPSFPQGCSLDHRAWLLDAAASGPVPFREMLDAYADEEPYFATLAHNVKAELVAAFTQGRDAGAGARLTNRQGYWTVAGATDYTPKRLNGCILIDKATNEVFWVLRSSASSCRDPRRRGRAEPLPASVALDVDVMLRVWFGAGETKEGPAGAGHGNLKELCPSFDILSLDAQGGDSMNVHDRVVEVVMFAADYADRYAAALLGASDLVDRDLLAMILRPAKARPSSFKGMGNSGFQPVLHQLNLPQREAVRSLKHRLEVIHGPPGTGKSTTIFGLLLARVPEKRTACVTCVTNQAVEAVCEKLLCVQQHLPFAVLGSPESLGPCSRRFLLERLVSEDELVVKFKEIWQGIQQEVLDYERRRVEVGSGTAMFKLLGQQLETLRQDLEEAKRDLDDASEYAARYIVRETRIFVCTIASLHRITVLAKQFGRDFPGKPHTIVVDEAGATPESYVTQILQTGVENLVLLGDHKQLPPLVLTLDVADMEAKQVNRSLMERALAQMPAVWVHRLTVQYRMPVAICELVSRLFYESMLTTGGWHAERSASGGWGAAQAKVSLRWLVVKHKETSVGTSRQNLGEAAVIVSWLRRRVPEARKEGKTVKCLTFYRIQRNLIQAGLVDDEMKACVLSVDATQGSEADHVILSTVRSNDKGELGFCADPRRLCVALSRAKETLTIVGDPHCMRTGLWEVVWESVEVQMIRPPMEDLDRLKDWCEEAREAREERPPPVRTICKFFSQGRCKKPDCRFAHEGPTPFTESRPREPPRAKHESGYHPMARPTNLYPSPLARSAEEAAPCKFFAFGRCEKGRACTFSHNFAPGDKKITAEVKATASPCQFHAMGQCTKGSSCTFSHNFVPGDKRVAAILRKGAAFCEFYAQGRCRNGASCSFSHG